MIHFDVAFCLEGRGISCRLRDDVTVMENEMSVLFGVENPGALEELPLGYTGGKGMTPVGSATISSAISAKVWVRLVLGGAVLPVNNLTGRATEQYVERCQLLVRPQ